MSWGAFNVRSGIYQENVDKHMTKSIKAKQSRYTPRWRLWRKEV
jgi:hypothetical protein